jgi:hypothetical protein
LETQTILDQFQVIIDESNMYFEVIVIGRYKPEYPGAAAYIPIYKQFCLKLEIFDVTHVLVVNVINACGIVKLDREELLEHF